MENKNNTGEIVRQPKRKSALILLGTLTGAILLLLIFYPQVNEFMQTYLLPCALLTITGLRCPLCGGTRCVKALSQLDIAAAIYYNPMVVITGLYCAYLYIRLLISCCRRQYKPYSPKIGERGMIIILAVYLVFFIVRNLPFYRTYFY